MSEWTWSQTVVLICGVLLAAAALFAVYRLAKGPTLLDRVVASDVLVATVSAVLVVWMFAKGYTEFVILLVVTSLVTFFSAVVVSRFAADRIAAEHLDLDAEVAHYRRGPVSLRWVYLHMIEELARHAGHADILVEQIRA